MKNSIEQQTIRPLRSIQLGVIANSIPMFFELLRSGFSADITTGVSLEQMLCIQMDIAPDYLATRVQTVFLNSSPIDDLTSTVVPDRAVISLSAAMPGLNGAMMRKGSPLAGLRRSISHEPDKVYSQSSPGRITLKLFNLVAKELGPHFLARGIVVNAKTLAELFKRQTPSFWQGVESAEIDRSSCQVNQFILDGWPAEQEVLFVVQPNE